jgi:hypothetical protein
MRVLTGGKNGFNNKAPLCLKCCCETKCLICTNLRVHVRCVDVCGGCFKESAMSCPNLTWESHKRCPPTLLAHRVILARRRGRALMTGFGLRLSQGAVSPAALRTPLSPALRPSQLMAAQSPDLVACAQPAISDDGGGRLDRWDKS